jgi:hypothetical protein
MGQVVHFDGPSGSFSIILAQRDLLDDLQLHGFAG